MTATRVIHFRQDERVTYSRQNRLREKVVRNEDAVRAFAEQAKIQRNLMRERLVNWGRWMNRNNNAVIDRDTGQIRVSMSGRVMEFAPFVEKSGYVHEAPEPVDTEDAEIIAGLVSKSEPEYKTLLRQIYEHGMAYGFLAGIYRCSTRTIERRCAAAVDQLGA